MSLSEFIGKNLEKGAKFYFEHPARFLQVAGVIGFATSCLCQAFTIVINKTIPAKEKKFLVPQELTDGAVNIGIFLAVTSPFRMRADKWAKGKVLSWLKNIDLSSKNWEPMFKRITHGMDIKVKEAEKEVIKPLSEILIDKKESLKALAGIVDNTNPETLENFITLMAEADFNNPELVKSKIANDAIWDILESNKNYVANVGNVLKNNWFNKGAQISAYLAGQLIAVNLIAPVVRNKVGAMYQKKSYGSNTTVNKPPLPITNSFCSNPGKPDVNISNYLSTTRSLNKTSI